jgi:endoglycosylceramidase
VTSSASDRRDGVRTRRWPTIGSALGAVVAGLIVALAAFACGGPNDDDRVAPDGFDAGDDGPGRSDDDDWTDDDDRDPWPDGSLTRLTARDRPQRGIYDAFGRQVLLRGVNFNHLGDYFQTDPSLPTVADLGPDDWDDAAALGTNVVRLVTTWSAWEPERGRIDPDYLARVRDAVAEANARGIYVVLDMHQDAWSKFVFTPIGETCPEGTAHQRGWDGAPAWATFTDGEPTCTPGRREDSPAVVRAWDHFYRNTDGIRDELAELWGFIAEEFADDDGVAGYDLLNEPGSGSSPTLTMQGLTDFHRSAAESIRAAERRAGSPGHVLFLEPGIEGIPHGFGLGIENSVFAGHMYFEVFNPLSLDFGFALFDLLGRIYDAPVWSGEYNHFGDSESADAWMARYATLEDRYRTSGGAWWQWEQECGDPHNAMWPPTLEWIEQQRARCGDARFPVRACLDRAYPRAAPGRLTGLSASPCGEGLVVTGVTGRTSVADLWFPSASADAPVVTGDGVQAVAARRVEGGWRIDVTVNGAYRIEVAPAADRSPD